jgi:hypothetical protein
MNDVMMYLRVFLFRAKVLSLSATIPSPSSEEIHYFPRSTTATSMIHVRRAIPITSLLLIRLRKLPIILLQYTAAITASAVIRLSAIAVVVIEAWGIGTYASAIEDCIIEGRLGFSGQC